MEIEEDKNPYIEEEHDEFMQFDKNSSAPKGSSQLQLPLKKKSPRSEAMS
jgi:hypothetical protein